MEKVEKFRIKYKVTASDMDVVYRMTPNAMLMYFQDCFANYLSGKRLAAFDIADKNLIWMITEFEVSVIGQRPYWSEDILVEIWFSGISAVKSHVDFRLYDKDGSLFSYGTSTWIILNYATKRPCSPLALLSDDTIPASRKKKHTLPSCEIDACWQSFEHKVNVTDLDFNGHVCNRSYLALAASAFSVEFVRTHDLFFLQIKFMNEAFFGDVLTCEVFRHTESASYWSRITNAENKPVCEIYSRWVGHETPCVKRISEEISRPEADCFHK